MGQKPPRAGAAIDAVVGDGAGDAIGRKKMDGIEKIGLQIGSQLVKGGAIQQGTGMAVVLVLF